MIRGFLAALDDMDRATPAHRWAVMALLLVGLALAGMVPE